MLLSFIYTQNQFFGVKHVGTCNKFVLRVFVNMVSNELHASIGIRKEEGNDLNQPQMAGHKCMGDRNRQTNGWTDKRPRYQSDFVQDVSEIWMTCWMRVLVV